MKLLLDGQPYLFANGIHILFTAKTPQLVIVKEDRLLLASFYSIGVIEYSMLIIMSSMSSTVKPSFHAGAVAVGIHGA
jgi:hypothetical protein